MLCFDGLCTTRRLRNHGGDRSPDDTLIEGASDHNLAGVTAPSDEASKTARGGQPTPTSSIDHLVNERNRKLQWPSSPGDHPRTTLSYLLLTQNGRG